MSSVEPPSGTLTCIREFPIQVTFQRGLRLRFLLSSRARIEESRCCPHENRLVGLQSSLIEEAEMKRNLTVVFMLLAALCCFQGCQKTISKEEMLAGLTEEQRRALDPMSNTPLVVDGIKAPIVVDAGEAKLLDSTQVIGVFWNGISRAYPISSFLGMFNHVVNDRFELESGEKLPVTVTYCDMTDCIRVLTSDTAGEDGRLDVGTLGLIDGGMALRWKDHQFKQSAEVEGLIDISFERTTWGEWKAMHPDSKVYIGARRTPESD